MSAIRMDLAETDEDLSVKVAACVSLFLVCLLVNTGLLIVMQRGNRRVLTTNRLMIMLSVSNLLCGVINSIVLFVSTFSGEWLFGEAMCQVHGLVGLTLITGSTWLLAIAAMERYCKLIMPVEYPSMFSETNTKILVVGCYLLMAVLCTNPLYGIGEYNYLRGKFDFGVNMTNATIRGAEIQPIDVLVPRYGHYYMAVNIKQLPASVPAVRYLEDNLNLIVRSVRERPGSLLFSLQAKDMAILDHFWSSHINGSLAEALGLFLWHQQQPKKYEVFHVITWVYEEQYTIYRDSHMPFQELCVCMVDFTNTNPHTQVLVGLLLTLTVITPYGIMIFCYGSIYLQRFVRKCYMARCDICQEDRNCLKALSWGSLVCLCFVCPYYVINIYNGRGINVPLWVNFVCTFLLYCNSLTVGLFYAVLDRTFVQQFVHGVLKCCDAENSVHYSNEEDIPLKNSKFREYFRRRHIKQESDL